MKLRIIECPVCGHLNRNVDLEDSKGWMECDRCGMIGIIPNQKQDQFETQADNIVRYLKPMMHIMTGAASNQ